MPLTIAAPELGLDAPVDFGAALSNAATEYQEACEREATQVQHEKAELFCRYVELLHGQDSTRVDDVLDAAHQLGLSANKARADYGVIAEVNRLQAVADTKDQAQADYQAAANDLIAWRESFNTEVARRMQAMKAAEQRTLTADYAIQDRRRLMDAHAELFPDFTPAAKPHSANAAAADGYVSIQEGFCGPCLKKL